jgi:hypothetical protein
MAEPRKILLTDLVRERTDEGDDWTDFHCKVFSFLLPDPSVFEKYGAEVHFYRDSFPNRHPAFVLVADASTLPLFDTRIVPIVVPPAKLHVTMNVEKVTLPSASYLMLVSPISKANGATSYASAFESMNFVRAVFSLNFATLVGYSQVVEFDFDDKGQVHSLGPMFRMPQAADTFKILDFATTVEVLERLKAQLPEFRTRFQTACTFLGRAIDQQSEMFRFASNWIALEIQSGRANQIRHSLMKAYSHLGKTVQAIVADLKFGVIKSLRTDLFHYGRLEKFTAFQERLVQLYFWDIAIDQLGLAHRGYAAALVAHAEELK